MKPINFATHPAVQAVRLRKLRTIGRRILPQELDSFKAVLADQEKLVHHHGTSNQHEVAE